MNNHGLSRVMYTICLGPCLKTTNSTIYEAHIARIIYRHIHGGLGVGGMGYDVTTISETR